MTEEPLPVFSTREEKHMLWSMAGDDPFMGIRNANRGFLFIYNMGTTGATLDSQTVQALRNKAKPYRMEIGPESQIELVGGEIGSYSGTVCCGTEADAQALAEDLRPLIEDSNNWTY